MKTWNASSSYWPSKPCCRFCGRTFSAIIKEFDKNNDTPRYSYDMKIWEHVYRMHKEKIPKKFLYKFEEVK